MISEVVFFTYYFYLLFCVYFFDYFGVIFLLFNFILFIVLIGPFTMTSFFSLDVLSWVLIILVTFLFSMMILGSLNLLSEDSKGQFYFFLMGTLILFLYMCFYVSSYFMFYLAFECSVIPILLIILGWGYSHERLQAGMYLFMYTLILSLPFLVFLMFLYNTHGMGDYFISIFYYKLDISFILTLMCVMVFLMKFPLYGVHLWLPKAHVEAPLSGSMILAGVLLKLGGYGFIRFFYFFVFYYTLNLSFFFWGMLGAFYSMLICFRQIDMKCLVAYMSVSHMSLMVGAFMTLKFYSYFGFVIMLVSHGFSSPAMFALLGVSYNRLHSRSILIMKSNFYCVSLLGLWGFLITLSGMSCPPTLNFFSEIFLVWGLFSFGHWPPIIIFCLYFLMGSFSLIHFFMSLFHGKIVNYIYMSPLTVSESLFLLMFILPLLIGFLLF